MIAASKIETLRTGYTRTIPISEVLRFDREKWDRWSNHEAGGARWYLPLHEPDTPLDFQSSESRADLAG